MTDCVARPQPCEKERDEKKEEEEKGERIAYPSKAGQDVGWLTQQFGLRLTVDKGLVSAAKSAAFEGVNGIDRGWGPNMLRPPPPPLSSFFLFPFKNV